jgi:predicted secreted protein
MVAIAKGGERERDNQLARCFSDKDIYTFWFQDELGGLNLINQKRTLMAGRSIYSSKNVRGNPCDVQIY